jgi:hypothetical protein
MIQFSTQRAASAATACLLAGTMLLLSGASGQAQSLPDRWTSPDGAFSIETPASAWRREATQPYPERKLTLWSVGAVRVISCTVLQANLPPPTTGATQEQLNASVRRPTREDAERASPSLLMNRYEFRDVSGVTAILSDALDKNEPNFRLLHLTFMTPGVNGPALLNRIDCVTDQSAPPSDIARIEALFASLQFTENGTAP